MDDTDTQVADWRERAKSLRTLAKQMKHLGARNDLMEIVERWEMKATRVETRLRLSRRTLMRRQAESQIAPA